MLKNKTIFVSGGTGSAGRALVEELLKSEIEKIIIFSRDEYKQFHMRNELKDSRLEYVIGDIRDLDRLKQAMKKADFVVHASAYKQIPILEENPTEAIKTNILGSENIIKAVLDSNVEKALLISSDKAVYPINIYGATKLCAEKLFIQANQYSNKKFSVARYGNVIGSRGSVIEKFLHKTELKEIGLTDDKMTRFWITLQDAYNLIFFALENMEGGEIFIPQPSSMKVTDLLKTLIPKAKQIGIGRRYGEKFHEILLTGYESEKTYQIKGYFVLLPDIKLDRDYSKYLKGDKINNGFELKSDTNSKWLEKDELQVILKKLRNESK